MNIPKPNQELANAADRFLIPSAENTRSVFQSRVLMYELEWLELMVNSLLRGWYGEYFE